MAGKDKYVVMASNCAEHKAQNLVLVRAYSVTGFQEVEAAVLSSRCDESCALDSDNKITVQLLDRQAVEALHSTLYSVRNLLKEQGE